MHHNPTPPDTWQRQLLRLTPTNKVQAALNAVRDQCNKAAVIASAVSDVECFEIG